MPTSGAAEIQYLSISAAYLSISTAHGQLLPIALGLLRLVVGMSYNYEPESSARSAKRELALLDLEYKALPSIPSAPATPPPPALPLGANREVSKPARARNERQTCRFRKMLTRLKRSAR